MIPGVLAVQVEHVQTVALIRKRCFDFDINVEIMI